MKTDDFNFDLPESSIAQYPTERRGDSRLFVLERLGGAKKHSVVASLASFLQPGTVMVFNDSRVRKARLYGEAADSGARVEFLLLSPLMAPPSAPSSALSARSGADQNESEVSSRLWAALCGKAGRQKPGRTYRFPGGLKGTIVEAAGEQKIVEFDAPLDDKYLEAYGHVPLPPYIKRGDESADAERYQTIYAKNRGSAACPTAGLHFTKDILDSIATAGVEMEWVTLHVGLGTFLPLRTEVIEQHKMHEEWYTVPEKTAAAVNAAKREGRKVLAVGTTSLRTLESAWEPGRGLRACAALTDIFIYPGYRFNVVDQLFTNFHTPKSTLLMLVSAFAGREAVLQAYGEAVEKGYRFFSYGDAMLIL